MNFIAPNFIASILILYLILFSMEGLYLLEFQPLSQMQTSHKKILIFFLLGLLFSGLLQWLIYQIFINVFFPVIFFVYYMQKLNKRQIWLVIVSAIAIIFASNNISAGLLELLNSDLPHGGGIWGLINSGVLVIGVVTTKFFTHKGPGSFKTIPPKFSILILCISLAFTLFMGSIGTAELLNIDFVIVVFFFFLTVHSFVSESEKDIQKTLIEASEKYNSILEKSYDELRILKHDYINILASLKLYIDNEDIEGLKKYYDQLNIFDVTEVLDLRNMQVSEIKSLLLFKLDNSIQLEIRETIDSFGINTAVLCQILGILIDNAKEAKINYMRIAFIKNPNSKTIIIKNDWKPQDISVKKIYEKGFSTKGSHRGIGLNTVKKYTDKFKNLYLETEIGETFTQTLTIKD